MIQRLLALLLVSTAAVSCQSLSGPSTELSGEYEILANPKLLADFSVPIEKLTLRGVALGDTRDAIRANRIYNEDGRGWILCRDSARYRIIDGKVVTLGVWDLNALESLGIEKEADIERVFGKAEGSDKVDTFSTKMTIYRYKNGERRVSWNRGEDKLSTVNIGLPFAATNPSPPSGTPGGGAGGE